MYELFGPVVMRNLFLHCFSRVPAIMHSGTIQRIRNVGRLRAFIFISQEAERERGKGKDSGTCSFFPVKYPKESPHYKTTKSFRYITLITVHIVSRLSTEAGGGLEKNIKHTLRILGKMRTKVRKSSVAV